MIHLRSRLIVFGLAYFSFIGTATARSLVIGRVSSDASQTYQQLKPMVDYVASRLADIGITDGQVLMAKNHNEMLRYLREGRVDWVQKTVFEALIYNREGGAEIAIRSWRQGVPNYHTVMFARKDGQIASLKDLVGKKIGIVRIGGLAEFLARYMLTEKLGLKPTEVELIQVGGQSVRVAALASGAIHASVFSPPESTRVEKLGLREIADASELEYPTGVIATTTQVLSSQPALAERVLKSYLEGIAFFRQQKEKTVAILQKEFRLSDRAEVEGMYVKLLKVVPAKPRFPNKGVETVLDDLKARNPNAARMDPNLFFDSGIVKKLEAQGFINNLYH